MQLLNKVVCSHLPARKQLAGRRVTSACLLRAMEVGNEAKSRLDAVCAERERCDGTQAGDTSFGTL
jgi:hypothetical protein